jgi:hypothetical protein
LATGALWSREGKNNDQQYRILIVAAFVTAGWNYPLAMVRKVIE